MQLNHWQQINKKNITSNSVSNYKNDKIIAIWLLCCCTTIFAMVVLGGVTRLTGSGLSMVQWQPILGILPPLSLEQWQATFNLYQLSPEFIYKNNHMTLEEFKSIFWLEYFHRLLGRTIGFIFLLPMLYFIIKGWVAKTLTIKLLVMFVLGGLQGLLGWYMVKSGLVNDPYVSQYRLTAHLGLAFLIYAYIFWVALGLLLPGSKNSASTKSSRFKNYSLLLMVMVFITILSGGFVAGTKAGFAFNTFPLMEGQLIPDGLLSFEPIWLNFFENILTIQFDHRVLAITVFVMVTALWMMSRRIILTTRIKVTMNLLMLVVILQVCLGIATLLLRVPIPLAASHQAGALLLFTICLYLFYELKGQKVQ